MDRRRLKKFRKKISVSIAADSRREQSPPSLPPCKLQAGQCILVDELPANKKSGGGRAVERMHSRFLLHSRT